MKLRAYYNDSDPKVCAWLRELIADGLIPLGRVDERSIADVQPKDLEGFVQHHFFCGIAGWPLALRLAGWPDDQPVVTGSCPCQPFSAAGKRRGHADERHLWPEFFRLIKACRPPTIFGEQVASSEVVGTELEASFIIAVQGGEFARANRLAHQLARSKSLHYPPRWVDGIRTDLEAIGYAFRFDVLGAHSLGAPHIRQRLWWVAQRLANAQCVRARPGEPIEQGQPGIGRDRPAIDGEAGGLANAEYDGSHRAKWTQAKPCSDWQNERLYRGGVGRLEHPTRDGRQPRRAEPVGRSVAGGCGDSWQRVVFASECEGYPEQCVCPNCGTDYAECGCPGPTQDGYEYEERGGIMYARWVGDAEQPGLEGHAGHESDRDQPGRLDQDKNRPVGAAGGDSGLAHSDGRNPGAERQQRGGQHGQQPQDGGSGRLGHATAVMGIGGGDEPQRKPEGRTPDRRPGPWSDSILIQCNDGKSRRLVTRAAVLASGLSDDLADGGNPRRPDGAISPLARNFPNRVALLRGLGNAIVPHVASEFIRACADILDHPGPTP